VILDFSISSFPLMEIKLMAKRKLLVTEKLIDKWIAQKRSQGEGANYKPWLTIQDVPSQGLCHRIKGWKNGRVHHLFSNLEANIFYTYEWSPLIVDIMEQYALLPQEETLAIAKEIGVRHPADPRTHYPIVMTTDFFLRIKRGLHYEYQARTAKYESDLKDLRTLEKLEIERRYWRARNIDWDILKETDLSMPLVENVKWFHPLFRLMDLYPLTQSSINEIADELTRRVLRDDLPLRHITRACDAELQLQSGWSLTVVRHLLANRYWQVDMSKLIRPFERLALLNIPRSALYGERRRLT
jgi:hypothetical protein